MLAADAIVLCLLLCSLLRVQAGEHLLTTGMGRTSAKEVLAMKKLCLAGFSSVLRSGLAISVKKLEKMNRVLVSLAAICPCTLHPRL